MAKANMPVTIRPLAAADRSGWADLWTAYLTFYDSAVEDSVYDSNFARLMRNDPRDFSGLVAEQDGKLVGLTHYLFHRHGWRIEEVCFLQDLYTVQDARGQGVGRRLIEAVNDIARRRGAHNVYWNTATDNAAARALYDRIATLTPFLKYQKVL